MLSKYHRFLFVVLISALACAAGLLPSAEVQAASTTTFYVAPSGSDDNPGSEEKPFATIEKARQAVRAVNKSMTGDIVAVLRGGVYRIDRTITFEPEDSGTGGHNVIYRAATGETAIISGGKPVAGWQADRNGRWKTPAPVDDFRQLYVGGVRAIRARSGVIGTDADPSRWEYLQDPSRGGGLPEGSGLLDNEGYRTPAAAMANWRNQGDIEFCYTVDWTHTRCRVESITREGDQAVVKMLQPYFLHARTKEGVQAAMPAYIENAFELLDEPGEWYLDRPAGMVYYMPRPGEDMTKVEVIAPVVETLVAVRGTLDKPAEHLRFEGITFQHGGWLLPGKIGLVDVQANFIVDSHREDSFSRAGGFANVHNEQLKSPANVICHAAKSVCFERCTFTQLGGAGLDIEFGSQDNVVSGCWFHDISGTAVQIGDVLKDDHHPDDPRKIVKNNSVVNCSIHDCCLEYMGGVGIFAGYTEGTRLAHNEIARLPYSGISVGWGWGEEDAGGGAHEQPFLYDTPTPARNNHIEYNHIHKVMNPMNDGGGIYTLGNMPGTVIRGNHIHDIGSPGGTQSVRMHRIPTAVRIRGIYLDEGSGYIEIKGNVVHADPQIVVKQCIGWHIGTPGNMVSAVQQPMYYNNRPQNRIATCQEHDNFFGVTTGTNLVPGKLVKAVMDKAGLEPQYRGLLKPDGN